MQSQILLSSCHVTLKLLLKSSHILPSLISVQIPQFLVSILSSIYPSINNPSHVYSETPTIYNPIPSSPYTERFRTSPHSYCHTNPGPNLELDQKDPAESEAHLGTRYGMVTSGRCCKRLGSHDVMACSMRHDRLANLICCGSETVGEMSYRDGEPACVIII
jgi:hypothetical protein